MTEKFSFKKAAPVSENFRIGIAGPSTSGKTVSALRMATGFLQGTGKRILLMDTENNRALKYAKHFDFDHYDFQPPFGSLRYLEVLKEAESRGYGAVILDSMSHEHEGAGGLLEQHESFLQDKAGDDYKRREALKFTAWIKPKAGRNKLIQEGIQRVNCHLILCFRAKEKIEMKKDEHGKTQIVPIGWQPIAGEEFPYEMLSMMILPPLSKGKPDWTQQASTINSLDKQLIDLLHGIEQISEDTGKKMIALGGANTEKKTEPQKEPATSDEIDVLADKIVSAQTMDDLKAAGSEIAALGLSEEQKKSLTDLYRLHLARIKNASG